MNARIGHQIGLKLGQVDIERAVKTQRGRDGGDDLCNETIHVRVRWTIHVQVAPANVVYGLIVDHESTIRMLQCSMRRQNRVVRLNNGFNYFFRKFL